MSLSAEPQVHSSTEGLRDRLGTHYFEVLETLLVEHTTIRLFKHPYEGNDKKVAFLPYILYRIALRQYRASHRISCILPENNTPIDEISKLATAVIDIASGSDEWVGKQNTANYRFGHAKPRAHAEYIPYYLATVGQDDALAGWKAICLYMGCRDVCGIMNKAPDVDSWIIWMAKQQNMVDSDLAEKVFDPERNIRIGEVYFHPDMIFGDAVVRITHEEIHIPELHTYAGAMFDALAIEHIAQPTIGRFKTPKINRIVIYNPFDGWCVTFGVDAIPDVIRQAFVEKFLNH